METQLPVTLWAAGALFAVALLGVLYWRVRTFVRGALDGIPRDDDRYFPWWAILSLGLALLCLEAAVYRITEHVIGAGVLGAAVTGAGLVAGRRMGWRLRFLFDAHDQDQRGWTVPHVERAPPASGDPDNPYPHDIPAETMRSNGLGSLAAAALLALAAYGVLSWGRSGSGEAGFGGVLFVGLFFILALGAVMTGLQGAIAWLGYLRHRPEEGPRPPLDWSWAAIGPEGMRSLAMLVGGIVLMRLPGVLSLAAFVGWPLALYGAWRCLRGVIRRVAERLAG